MTDQPDELGYVIERYYDSVLHYWNGRSLEPSGFTSQNAEAIRFSRSTDAEIVLGSLLGGLGRVAQHSWNMRRTR